MRDIQTAKHPGSDVMTSPLPVQSKVDALDALDRLALNPNGWFPGPLLNKLTEARVAIIVDRWNDALVILEDTYEAIEHFIGVLDKGPERVGDETRESAAGRARMELEQCSRVQEFVGRRVADQGN